MESETKLVDGLRRSNLWFNLDVEGRRRHPRESTKALYDRKLKPLAKGLRSILEIGCCEGASCLWLWENIKPDLWVGVDPWFPDRQRHAPLFKMWRENFWWNVEASGAENLTVPPEGGRRTTEFRFGPTRCLMAEWPSQEYLRHQIDVDVPGQKFDAVLVDGDHHGAEAMQDMVFSWRHLKKGGLMIIDDYERRWLHGRAHVKEAATAFFTAFEDRVEKAMECKRQLWLRKRTEV